MTASLGEEQGLRAIESRVQWAAALTLGLVLAAHTLMETGRDALFLTNIPAERLPWVYLAGALLALGLVRISRGSGLDGSQVRRVVALQILAAASALGFWWAAGSFGPWLYYVLYVWTGVISSVIVVAFWILVGEFFTVTQAKRLFAPVAMGGSLGAVGGAGIAAVVAPHASAETLLVIAAAFFAASALGPSMLPRDSVARVDAGEAPPEASAAGLLAGLRQIVSHPYALRVALLVAVASGALTLGDYLFKSLLAEQVAADQLSTWLARIYLGLNLLSIVVLASGVRPLIARLGVDRSLILLPVMVALATVGILMGLSLASIVLLKTADGALRHSLHKTASEILYLPMDHGLRRSVKGVIDVVANSAAKAVASMALLGLAMLSEGPMVVAGLLLLLALVWAGLALRLRGPYLDVFRRTLHRGSIETRIDLPELDLDSVASLLRALSSPEERVVLGAMELLHERNRCALIPSLILYHPSPDVVARAVDIFALSARNEVLDFADRLLDHEYARVRSAIVRAVALLEPDEAWLRGLEDASCPCIRVSAVAGLLAHGWADGESALREFEEAVAHHEPDTRMAVANAAKLRYSEIYRTPLALLAVDTDVAVASEAIRAMQRSGDRWFTGPLVGRLGDRHTRDLVREALVGLGDEALRALSEALKDPEMTVSVLRHIPRTIARFPGEQAAGALLEGLENVQNGMVRYKILRGLEALTGDTLRASRVADRVVTELRTTVDRALHLRRHELNLLRGRHEDPTRETVGGGLLVDLVRDKRRLATGRIFLLLSLVHPEENFQNIQAGIRSERASRQASGIELLESLLARDLRQAVLDLVSPEAELPVVQGVGQTHTPVAYAAAVQRLAEDPSEALRAFAMYHADEISVAVEPDEPVGLDRTDALSRAVAGTPLRERALSIIERLPDALARRVLRPSALAAR